MAFITTDRVVSPPPLFGSLRAGLAAFSAAVRTYRGQRQVYLRTLRELQSYAPHELQDLRIQPSDFEALARNQAGW